MDFSQLYTCAPEAYAGLKQQVDTCARLGRSYVLGRCRLPEGCLPREADLGFFRCGEGYLVFVQPQVRYQGPDPRLLDFFGRGPSLFFPDFAQLQRCLRSLGGPPEAAPSLFSTLQRELNHHVLGQERAVEAVAFKLWGHICKKAPQRPLSLVFYGPTCVGKSRLGKQLAPTLNRCCGQTRYTTVWTELNTFTQPHSVYRLTGSPPGYVGYDDPPILEAVRHNPCTVFLFDELDKAHPEILKTFMSILDEGRCTARREDEQGSRELDFRRCIFVFTTNTDLSASPRRLGFAPPGTECCVSSSAPPGGGGLAGRLLREDDAARQAMVRAGVLQEIAGRFSGLVGFRPLTDEARRAITVQQIAALGREYGLEISGVSPELARLLTPPGAASPRSNQGLLEGVLTPLLLLAEPGGPPLRLAGTPEHMQLLPA